MNKDSLEEFNSAKTAMAQALQAAGMALFRMEKILEKEQERERLLGITREVEDFENPK